MLEPIADDETRGYEMGPLLVQGVAIKKWLIRIWAVGMPACALASGLPTLVSDVAFAIFLVVGLPPFAFGMWIDVRGMWRERRGQLPGPNDWSDWSNRAWAAGWRAAWKRSSASGTR